MTRSIQKYIERLKANIAKNGKDSSKSQQAKKDKETLKTILASCDHVNEDGFTAKISWHPWVTIIEPYCSICGKKFK